MRTLLLVLATFMAISTPALAGIPAGDDTGGGGADDNNDHVWKYKPWKARFVYKVVRQARAYTELNSRSDVSAEVQQGQWWAIDCQLTNTTQNGRVIWDHVANVGWVADHNLRTYTEGPLEGAPSCADPTGAHVWFEQPWSAEKQYRLKRDSVVRIRPAGEINPFVSLPKGIWTTIQCSARESGKDWIRLTDDGAGHQAWINSDALKLWQKGLPSGLPGCTGLPRDFVVLGDSYAAGIGAGDYYTPGDTCYRSTKSYWTLLSAQLAPGLISPYSDFEACSGDTTADLRQKLAVLSKDAKLITVSIGGNDMHFGDVISACATPLDGKSCSEAIGDEFTIPKLAGLKEKLATTYDAIRTAAPRAYVLVLGYPRLVPTDHIDGCADLDDNDAPGLTQAATQLNDTIREVVQGRHKFKFVGLYKTFKDHPACNKDAQDWINGISKIAPDHKASFHPNVEGNAAIAAHIREVAPHFFG